jgi:hypothetical protein
MAIEKYQFDTGSGDFMDITNNNVYPTSVIAERFPYLYSDIEHALKTNKEKIEADFAKYSEDPAMAGSTDTSIKKYDIDKQLKDLEVFRKKGHFTDKIRPKEKTQASEPSAEQPQKVPTEQEPQPEQGQQPMESIRSLARQMLEEYDLEEDDEMEEDDSEDTGIAPPSKTGGGLGSMGGGAGPTGGGQYPPGTAPTMPESAVNEAPGIAPKSMMTSIARWYSVHGDQLTLSAAIRKFAKLPANAPVYFDDADLVYGDQTILPRALVNPQYTIQDAVNAINQHNNQGNIMENVDKDVAAMLASLKKYDKLTESVAPVLMARPKPVVTEEEKEDKNPWEKLASDKKDDEEKTSKTHKGGTVTKTEKGLVHKAADKKVDEKKEVEEDKEKVEEGADQEVLAWMGRFAKLGNMKGYGR